MALPVITVAAGGLPVIEVTNGLPVSEAGNKFGLAVTKVTGKLGLPVTFVPIAGGAAAGFASLDGVAKNVTLSNGNLTATHSANTIGDGARSATLKSTGKFYFEVSPKNMRSNDTIGVAISTAAYVGISSGTADAAIVYGNGTLWGKGNYFGKDLPNFATSTTHIICAAVDVGANLAWFRLDAGPWNNDATANPATGVGGMEISWNTGTFGPTITFDGTIGASAIANFGASAFTGTVPTGFTAGWTTP